MLKKRKLSKEATTSEVDKSVLKKLRDSARSVVSSKESSLTRVGQEQLVRLLKERTPPTKEMKALRRITPLKVRS